MKIGFSHALCYVSAADGRVSVLGELSCNPGLLAPQVFDNQPTTTLHKRCACLLGYSQGTPHIVQIRLLAFNTMCYSQVLTLCSQQTEHTVLQNLTVDWSYVKISASSIGNPSLTSDFTKRETVLVEAGCVFPFAGTKQSGRNPRYGPSLRRQAAILLVPTTTPSPMIANW